MKNVSIETVEEKMTMNLESMQNRMNSLSETMHSLKIRETEIQQLARQETKAQKRELKKAELIQRCQKYTSMRDLTLNEPELYQSVRYYKVSDVALRHFEKTNGFYRRRSWSDKSLLAYIDTFKDSTDLKRRDYNAYVSAKARGLI